MAPRMFNTPIGFQKVTPAEAQAAFDAINAPLAANFMVHQIGDVADTLPDGPRSKLFSLRQRAADARALVLPLSDELREARLEKQRADIRLAQLKLRRGEGGPDLDDDDLQVREVRKRIAHLDSELTRLSTRAARDLIDKLVEHDEPVEVFCVHDADASGTMIFQTLQEETKARGARRINIINLGLEPWEAVEMGLEVETVEEKERLKPVADYVRERDDGPDWERWLQTNRVELNAMTTPQLLHWLDRKMAEHGGGKLIPPTHVLEQELAVRIERIVREAMTERILREANLDERITAALAAIRTPAGAALARDIARLFKRQSDREWRDLIRDVASRLAEGA
ncbi:hypothetical protein [Bradyrhizobium sp. Ai1a-2]|uniref:hypothetical protein n=1 Tax=Bradyrhizobium sp. Ai1a-2 TaxID=196490 RepID=UPI000485D013|nr:hypothetical protein [Bradyrhizobium sp. Ai1a-2]